MKRILLLTIWSFLGLGLFAQTPLTEAVDFKAKDVNGQLHHLFGLLDNENQYVLIDFFSVTCGPCQTMAPKLDSVYEYFGENQLDLFVMAIDQNFNNEMVMEFEETYGTRYPAISGVEGTGSYIFESYQIPYYPSLVLIAPDHTIVEQAIPVPETAQEMIDLLENYNLGITVVDKVETNLAFNIYPNPASNYVHIEAPSSEEINQIQIYSLTGKEVFNASYGFEHHAEIDIANYQNGIYLISVYYSSGQRYSGTFVKK